MVAAMAHTSAAPTGGNNENFTQRSRRFLSDVCARTWSLITDHQQRMIRPSLLVLSSGRGLIDLLVRAWTSTAFLVSMLRIRRIVVTCDLRGVYDPVAAVACGDGETHYSKVRSDEVQDGPSCGAKQ